MHRIKAVHLAIVFAAVVLVGLVTLPLYVAPSLPTGPRTVHVTRAPVTRPASAPVTPPAPVPAGGEYPN